MAFNSLGETLPWYSGRVSYSWNNCHGGCWSWVLRRWGLYKQGSHSCVPLVSWVENSIFQLSSRFDADLTTLIHHEPLIDPYLDLTTHKFLAFYNVRATSKGNIANFCKKDKGQMSTWLEPQYSNAKHRHPGFSSSVGRARNFLPKKKF